jgi:hypothetical protein
LAKGYTYADTGFIRMTPASLAKLGGAVTPAPTPPVVVTPPVVKAGTVLTPGVTVKSVTISPIPQVLPPVTRIPALLALGEPWSLTHHLKVLRDGTTVKGYAAIDDSGDELTRFDPQGGIGFARDYSLEIDFKG